MNSPAPSTFWTILSRGEKGQPSEGDVSYATVTALLERGYGVSVAPSPSAAFIRQEEALLLLNEPDLRLAGAATLSSSEGGSADPSEQVERARVARQAGRPGEWKPWFPVIDYERCTNCMQCLSFCLFGVYGVDEQQRISVQTSENCKTNCPACSRVCPEAAILFPKYKSGPINGDVVSDEDLRREKMKIDISSLLGGDIYAMLRDRSARAKSRFSKERDSDKALEERKKCLVKLAQGADIPPEVLMALPSPEEIARRAEEAKVKAQAALAQRQS